MLVELAAPKAGNAISTKGFGSGRFSESTYKFWLNVISDCFMLGLAHGEVKLLLERNAASEKERNRIFSPTESHLDQPEHFCKKHTRESRLGKPQVCRYFENTILEYKIISLNKQQPPRYLSAGLSGLDGLTDSYMLLKNIHRRNQKIIKVL